MKTVQEKEGNGLFFKGSTHHRPIVSGAENIPFHSLSLSFICKDTDHCSAGVRASVH